MNSMMRKIIVVLLFVMGGFSASAQFSISRVKPKDLGTRTTDSIKRSEVSNEYYSHARWLAEKKRIRKERNTVEFNSSLQLAQTQFDNWAAGGDNTFSGNATIRFKHRYQRERLGLEYEFNGRYGINVIESKPFKNEDEFKLNLRSSWKIKNSWSYEASANLRSQFSNGYASRTDKTKKSTFMAPGFVDITVGFNYKKDKSPFDITISPIAGNLILVLDDSLSMLGINGVDPGKHVKGQVGPSIRVNFEKVFAKDMLMFRSNLYAFTNIRRAHTARWENTFEVRATKFLTTKLYGLFYYDNLADTPKKNQMQYNYSLSIGLAYTFKNK